MGSTSFVLSLSRIIKAANASPARDREPGHSYFPGIPDASLGSAASLQKKKKKKIHMTTHAGKTVATTA